MLREAGSAPRMFEVFREDDRDRRVCASRGEYAPRAILLDLNDEVCPERKVEVCVERRGPAPRIFEVCREDDRDRKVCALRGEYAPRVILLGLYDEVCPERKVEV